MIKKKYGQDATNVGDEGGFAPNIQVNIVYFDFLKKICYKILPRLFKQFVLCKFRRTRKALNCLKLLLLRLAIQERSVFFIAPRFSVASMGHDHILSVPFF